MASKHEIKCVNKTDRYNAHERIRAIGGQNSDGSIWKLTQEEAIQGVESGKWSFYVAAAEPALEVIVALSIIYKKYLKTEADSEQPNNLLSLYECR